MFQAIQPKGKNDAAWDFTPTLGAKRTFSQRIPPWAQQSGKGVAGGRAFAAGYQGFSSERIGVRYRSLQRWFQSPLQEGSTLRYVHALSWTAI
jgi:hypothetical protein